METIISVRGYRKIDFSEELLNYGGLLIMNIHKALSNAGADRIEPCLKLRSLLKGTKISYNA